MTDAVILSDVWKRFRTRDVETAALRGVSLTIKKGEWVSVTGPSGSGKSTLVTVIGLLEAIDGGQIKLFGNDVAHASADAKARMRLSLIGFVFQAFHLIPDLTVVENVAMGLVGLVRSKSRRLERAREVLDHLGLAARANHFPVQLSGGQQQRVAIARAMVRQPALLICDEPTGNLDSTASESALKLIAEMHEQGTTVVVVTHDEAVADRAGRRIRLLDGQVVSH